MAASDSAATAVPCTKGDRKPFSGGFTSLVSSAELIAALVFWSGLSSGCWGGLSVLESRFCDKGGLLSLAAGSADSVFSVVVSAGGS